MKLSLYNRELKRYDKDLFCAHTVQGALCVFRHTKRFVPVCLDDGFEFLNLISDKQFIFALTDNWTLRGQPRDWGVDFVLNRLREIDTQARERLMDELDQQNEKIDESKKRSFRNEAEAFWIDNRRAFAKATDDILVHSLSKDEPKKRLKEKSIKNGNY